MILWLFTVILAQISNSDAAGPSVHFANGHYMPLIAFGTWNQHGRRLRMAVRDALRAGYRHIDTSASYENEAEIGEILQEVFKNGSLKRADLFITTTMRADKLNPAEIDKNLRETLERLKLDYVDMLIAESPAQGPDPTAGLLEIWRAFEKMYAFTLARNIGVANWSGKQIMNVLESASVPMHVLQIEMHLYFPQRRLVANMQRLGITVMAYAPFGSASDTPLRDEKVLTIARKHRKTAQQVMLRYLLQRGVGVISHVYNKKKIYENMQILDFFLPLEDIRFMESTKHARKRSFQLKQG